MSASSRPDIDVIVPTYGSWDLTRSCLLHLRAQTLPHRVTVVDNASPDDTCALIGAEFPEVNLVQMGYNSGFSRACNRGVEQCGGEIVVLLNNDVDCDPNFLQRLVEPFEGSPKTASVAPLLLRPGRQLVDSFGTYVDATGACFIRCQGIAPEALLLNPPLPKLLGPYGAAAAYRRSAWLELGGLDENIFMYGEETELAVRLAASGYQTTSTVAAVAVHIGGATAKKASAWQRKRGGFSRGYLVRRYNLMLSRVALRVLLTELLATAGDALISRDLAALRGRVAGWRAAKGLSKLVLPQSVISENTGFFKSLIARVRDLGG